MALRRGTAAILQQQCSVGNTMAAALSGMLCLSAHLPACPGCPLSASTCSPGSLILVSVEIRVLRVSTISSNANTDGPGRDSTIASGAITCSSIHPQDEGNNSVCTAQGRPPWPAAALPCCASINPATGFSSCTTRLNRVWHSISKKKARAWQSSTSSVLLAQYRARCTT